MKKLLLILLLTFSSVFAKEVYITTGSDMGNEVYGSRAELARIKETSVFKYDMRKLHALHEAAHKRNRCGGYFVHSTEEEALATIKAMETDVAAPMSYTITNTKNISQMTKKVSEKNIRDMIIKLSSFKNRYYKSKTGVQAANYIKEVWADILKDVPDAKVELYNHSWPQPSVKAVIKGESDEIVVIGGHLDSISGWFGGDNRAPGADDNASGIATTTEIMRVFVQNGVKPSKTIHFYGYAAEEVGLKGSAQIAKDLKKKKANIVAVLQLDMTNFNGSERKIYLTTDYTNQELTTYLGKLIDTYVKVPWGYDRCGYACSDHASWHREGYPSAFPFESAKRDMNDRIHTTRDTIDYSGGNADHAVNFARLGIAFLGELTR